MSDKNKAAPVIGVGVLIWREKKILLGERIAEGGHACWQFPGGHLENGESVTACAQREVLEETSLHIKGLRHLGFTDKPFEMVQRMYITLLISCEYLSGTAQVLEPDKCASWQWFDYRELPSPLFAPISIFLNQTAEASSSIRTTADLYALHQSSRVLPDAPSDGHK